MTIKINLQPKNIKAELGDYGIFTLRPMGINEDLLLSQYARELQESMAELDEIKTKAQGNISDEDQVKITKRLQEISEKMTKRKEDVSGIFKRLFICDDEKQHEKLFNEVPMDAIRKAYDEVMQNG